MENRSFKKQFIITFVKILAISLVLSLICFFLWISMFKYIYYPANYYENKIKHMAKTIDEKMEYEDLLNPNFQNEIDKIILIKGFSIKY